MPDSYGNPPARARARRAAIGVVCMLLLMLFQAPAAHAHAALVSTQPVDGAVLVKEPARAVLVFDEPVSPLVFTLVSPDGKTTALRRVAQHNERVTVGLPAMAASGTFGLSWRVVSADGHPVGGTFVFSVGAPGGSAVMRHTSGGARDVAIWLGRALLYAALFIGVGGALFRAWGPSAPAAPPRAAAVVALLGVLLVPATVVLQGLDALGMPFSSWSRPEVWRVAISTSYGLSAALSAGALAAALASLLVRGGPARGLSLAALAATGLALAATGHAGTASPVWLARPAVWIHGIAVTCWLGSLPPLWRMLGAGQGPAVRNLMWFSRWIAVVVVLLAGSGIVLAFLQFDQAASLWSTPYGRVFLAKMGLVAILLALAAYNRYRLTAAVVGGGPGAAASMRRVIAAEMGVALCILGVVALWRFTPPPRILARAESMQPVVVRVHGPAAMAELAITAARGGRPASMTISLMKHDGAVLKPRKVTVYFSNDAAGVQPIRRAAKETPSGAWRIDRLGLPALAVWDIRVDALVSDFDRISLEKRVRIGPGG